MKGGDILDFWKGGILRKGWAITPLTNYAQDIKQNVLLSSYLDN